MKKYISIIPITLIILSILISCKKSETPKDYTASIKDKTWWGQFTYNGETAEYYSVHFNADNTLIWSQLAGDYPGLWIINDKQLKMIFPALGSEIKGDISDNDTLMNISDNNASVTINSGKLIANPNILLDNTVWKGYAKITTSKVMELTFIPGSQVRINIENSPIYSYVYTRSLSGSVFRTVPIGGEVFFGVITSGSEMKGSVGYSSKPWATTKQ